VPGKLKLFVLLAVLVSLSGMAAAAWLTPRFYARELALELPLSRADWAASDACRSCHPDHYASWHRTFHRTMTQEANPLTVRGRFDGKPVTYWGVTVRPYEDDGRYFFEYLDPASGQRLRTLEVLRTVGSRRYQQYLALKPDTTGTYVRLELLWHIEDQRWVHMNGVFLGHDDNPFDAQRAVWNHGCIMCHNTGPVPGVVNWDQIVKRFMSGQMVHAGSELEYESDVVELGIGCASCHSPGSVHARRNRNPFRRYLLHFTEQRDNTIVNLEKLDKERSVEVCGQCHGQRLPKSLSMVKSWTEKGPTYRAGDDLDEHVDVVFRDTAPLDVSHPKDLFELRFWGDGTPRLTAYEMQGIRQSACYQQGELSCTSCHTMHGGDVYGQLPPEHRTKAACAGCHADIVSDVSGHTRHQPDGAGSDCYACHMPRMVYGIMEIHRSHHIEVPDPARDATYARPNACTSCHLDRSLAWAGQAARQWWGERFQVPAARGDGADVAIADTVAALLGGDPVQRAVAARMAGRADTPLTPQARALLIPHLLTAMKRDRYPAIRRFAGKSVAAITRDLAAAGLDLGMADGLAAFDFIGPAEERSRIVSELEARWARAPKQALPPPAEGLLLDSAHLPLAAEVERLLAQAAARSKEVNIGE
jgi:predicted CXXCH cytochrome family protein